MFFLDAADVNVTELMVQLVREDLVWFTYVTELIRKLKCRTLSGEGHHDRCLRPHHDLSQSAGLGHSRNSQETEGLLVGRQGN